MSNKTEFDRVVGLSVTAETSPLAFARALREASNHGDLFADLCDTLPQGLRKIENLISIVDKMELMRIDSETCDALGWTRVKVLAKFVTRANRESLLKYAQGHNAADLAAWCRGTKPAVNGKRYVVRVPLDDVSWLEPILLKEGMIKTGNGYDNVYTAIVNLAKKAGYHKTQKTAA